MAEVGDTVSAKMFTVDANIHQYSQPVTHATAATTRGVKIEASVSPFLKPNSVPVAGVPQISTAPSSALFSTIWGSNPAASEVGIVQSCHANYSLSVVNCIITEFLGY